MIPLRDGKLNFKLGLFHFNSYFTEQSYCFYYYLKLINTV